MQVHFGVAKNSMDLLSSLIGLGLCTLLGAKDFNICCLTVTLMNGRVCANDFDIKALEYRNVFVINGLGMVC